MKEAPPLWTPQRLAKRLSVSVRHVQNLAKEGEIPGSKRIGKNWRFDPEKIEAWLAQDAKPESID